MFFCLVGFFVHLLELVTAVVVFSPSKNSQMCKVVESCKPWTGFSDVVRV